ncbi:MAG: acetyl-CoA hydrolase [Firmicutes bacterium]|nr:acetyl-CoA hydrolase [Bacillota bacterium]
MEWKKEYTEKLMSPAQAAKLIRSGDRVYLGTASSIAYKMAEAIWDRRHELENVEIQSSNGYEASPLYDEYEDNPFSYNTYFLGVNERKPHRKGLPVKYNSVHLSQVDIWAKQNARPDVAILEVSPADENGYMALGPSGTAVGCDIISVAKTIILEVNKKIPYIYGQDTLVHISQAAAVVEVDRALLPYETQDPDDISKQLSKYILDEVPDGATIQLGLGNISTAIGYGLKEKNDLGIHTELFNQPMLELIKNGNVTNKCKGFMDGKTVYSFCYGNEELYSYLDKNPDFYCVPFTYANDPRIIAQNKKMISINTTMSFDLYGQAASDCLAWKQQSATGGQVDFVRGAQWSEGGKSFIATTSSFIKDGKRVSRIVPCFAPGSVVTTTRSDIQYVATEYGCVNLKPLCMADRARAMISLAHPDFRELLTDEAKKYGII